MIQGLITNDLAGAPEGSGVYAAMLTAKGRMVADMRAFRLDGDVLLDVDAAAFDAVGQHLRKFVPPLFAKPVVPGPDHAVVGVYGPDAVRVIGDALGAELPEDAPEDSFFRLDPDGLAVRTAHAGVPGYDLFVRGDAELAGADAARANPGQSPAARATDTGAEQPADADAAGTASELIDRLVAAGATRGSGAALEVLRIEAGRPRWGAELGPDRIPLEAGLEDRAISTGKGCYTGQEVIIRILHRGHVNWNLRRLHLGDAAVPDPGAELVRPGEEKVVARITSACRSPARGETIALGYVRREVAAGDELQTVDAELRARVEEL